MLLTNYKWQVLHKKNISEKLIKPLKTILHYCTMSDRRDKHLLTHICTYLFLLIKRYDIDVSALFVYIWQHKHYSSFKHIKQEEKGKKYSYVSRTSQNHARKQLRSRTIQFKGRVQKGYSQQLTFISVSHLSLDWYRWQLTFLW